MKRNLLMVLTILLVPMVSVAAGNDLTQVLTDTSDILVTARTVIFALAFIGFFWGLMQYIFTQGDQKEDGKKIMIWGIVVLVIMFSIWGIIGIVRNSFSGLSGTGSGTIPGIPTATTTTA